LKYPEYQQNDFLKGNFIDISNIPMQSNQKIFNQQSYEISLINNFLNLNKPIYPIYDNNNNFDINILKYLIDIINALKTLNIEVRDFKQLEEILSFLQKYTKPDNCLNTETNIFNSIIHPNTNLNNINFQNNLNLIETLKTTELINSILLNTLNSNSMNLDCLNQKKQYNLCSTNLHSTEDLAEISQNQIQTENRSNANINSKTISDGLTALNKQEINFDFNSELNEKKNISLKSNTNNANKPTGLKEDISRRKKNLKKRRYILRFRNENKINNICIDSLTNIKDKGKKHFISYSHF